MYDVKKNFLIGTVLGGSSLVKPPKGVNYYLSMRSQNRDWLIYKMGHMEKYFEESSIYQYGNTYRVNSCCHGDLTDVYETLYEENKRKVTMKVLDPFMDMGLSVWFLDNGGKTGRDKKNAYLNTTKFGEAGTDVIKEYFCSLEVPCNVNRDKERLRVLFTVEGTERYMEIIAYCFPPFMSHRT